MDLGEFLVRSTITASVLFIGFVVGAAPYEADVPKFHERDGKVGYAVNPVVDAQGKKFWHIRSAYKHDWLLPRTEAK